MTLDKHHIILYVVAIAFALGLTYTIESKVADQNEQKYIAMKALSDQKDSTNAQFQKQVTDTLQQLQSQSDQLKAQNAQQQATIVGLKQQLQDQKQKDSTLPPTDLAARIQTLAPGGAVTVIADGYKLDQAEAVSVAQTLEEPASLNQEIAVDKATITRDDQIIANDAQALTSEKGAHAGDVVTLNADKATLNQQVTTLKAELRKSKLKYFGIGFVAGAISGIAIHLPKL